MKKQIKIIGLFGLLTLVACGPRQIPERRMKSIIRDVFLVNAYQMQPGLGVTGTDSVDIYTPILNDHGYDLADFRHTIDRWALKKSSKLSELIDEAAVDIRQENERNIAIQERQNRLDTLIEARYLDTVYRRPDSLWVRNRRALDGLKFTIPAQEGKYRLRYRYLIDSTDRSSRITLRYIQKDSSGSDLRSNTNALTRDEVRWMDVTFQADSRIDSLEVILGDYRADDKTIAIRTDSVYILYNEPIEAARERYFHDMVRLSLGLETYPYEFTFFPKDSGALHVVPPLRPDTARHSDL